MDYARLADFIEERWEATMPSLLSYMAIPCETPDFDAAAAKLPRTN